MALETQLSCEIEDLIREIINHSKKSYDEVENAAFELGIYPENTKTFIRWQDKEKKSIIKKYSMQDYPELKWFDDALVQIFKENNINEVYITHAI